MRKRESKARRVRARELGVFSESITASQGQQMTQLLRRGSDS